jgi:transcriptional regulator with XRE-family HTH domain
MQQAGLTGKQAAQMFDVTPSYVSMLMSGKRAASKVDIAAFLGVRRVKGAERCVMPSSALELPDFRRDPAVG